MSYLNEDDHVIARVCLVHVVKREVIFCALNEIAMLLYVELYRNWPIRVKEGRDPCQSATTGGER